MTHLRKPIVPADDATIWRYMRDWKLNALLGKFDQQSLWEDSRDGETKKHFNEPGQVWFALPRAFEDDKEGTFPIINENPVLYCDRMAKELGLSDDEATRHRERFLSADTKVIREGVLAMAQLCGVSCWHESDQESSRMWTEYVGQGDGVAIKTTVKQLEMALATVNASPVTKCRPVVASVGYVDFETFFLRNDGFYNLLCLKGNGFRHENEVRVIAKSPWFCRIPLTVRRPFPLNPEQWKEFVGEVHQEEKQRAIKNAATYCNGTFAEIQTSDTRGFNLPLQLRSLLMEVITKPGSPDQYIQSARDRLADVGLSDIPVRASKLN